VKDTEVKFYLKHKDDKDIEEFRSWECTFDDDFSDNSSATKWSPLPFPAGSFIRGTYSQWDEDQFYTEDKNHFFSSGKLVLKTTREEAEGMAWHPKMGFVPKKFNYTSANLNSGKAFSQQFGKFEAKVKCAHAKGLSHILALSSGRLAPQIQLFKQIEKGDNKFSTGLIYAGRNGIPSRKECVVSGLDLSKDYHIFTLIWNENLIEWKVNGVTLAKQTNDVPKAPLFWNLLAVKPSEETLDKSSAEMEMEWVRAYKKKVS
jgi:beta-glucanase (GH16 family)